MTETLDDSVTKYLRRQKRFSDAQDWLPPRRVDIPTGAATDFHEMLASDVDDRDLTYTDFMPFAWPAELPQSNEPSSIVNLVERIVVQARLRLKASSDPELDDLHAEIQSLSERAPAPYDKMLVECWAATCSMLSNSDKRPPAWALGRFLSAYAYRPGWPIALDIAFCADWADFTGNELLIFRGLAREALQAVAWSDDAPSCAYLQCMLEQDDDEEALRSAANSVRRPEHPWIDLYIADQILRYTEIVELAENTARGWPTRRINDPESRSVFVPFHVLDANSHRVK